MKMTFLWIHVTDREAVLFLSKPREKQIIQGLKTRKVQKYKEVLQIKCWITTLRKENQTLSSIDFKKKTRKYEHQK